MAGDERLKKLRTSLADLEVAAWDRLDDFDALLAASRHAAAISSGLYALEIHLKVAICKKLDLAALPQAFEIHDLEALLILSGLSSRLKQPTASRVQSNWSLIVLKSQQYDLNSLRYTPSSGLTRADVETLDQLLRDPADGVIPWIIAHT